MNDPLFMPIKIKNLEISNRIYLPAMHLNMADNYNVTDRMIDFYAERAKGGAGMICVGYATIDEYSGNVGNIGAHKDDYIEGLSRLASAINENGSRSAVQLNHAGRYNFSFFINGKQPVAPSPIASKLTRETPKELSISEIKETINSFASAAQRVKKAGFDAVEVLAGTGYLISEFLSPLTNKRNDEYGGSFENRIRFALEIVDAIKKAIGEDFPLMIRMNGNDLMPGGIGAKELQKFAVTLEEKGVDALCINVGWHEARVPQIITNVPRGTYGYLSKEIKKIVNIPVIASHRINDPIIARDMISDEICDMVAMGRSLIADPYLPLKAKNNKDAEIIHCIACAQGCFDNLFNLKAVECLCNPRAGHEKETIIDKAEKVKKVMVIGGGAAGMSSALSAFERGHDVVIYDKADHLGGQLYIAGAPPGREEFSELAKDLSHQVAVKNIKIMLGQEVTEEIIDKENPDAIILATGAVPIKPSIKGVDMPHVVQAWDVLENKAYTGKNVVIIGAGAVGVETALFLAEKGTLSGEVLKFLFVNKVESNEYLYELATKGTKAVVLVEMIDKAGKDIGRSTRWSMLQDMDRFGIQTIFMSKAIEITELSLKIETQNGIKEINADTIVLAIGAKSYIPLKDYIEKKGIEYKIIGDANKIGKAFDAIHQGFNAGREI
ncbi:MAG: FAD-dependent oxidoreductase [Desulfobacterales bacterium]|nr:FAD-dependent oxidoreductase [Desulfobacterales bacterium]